VSRCAVEQLAEWQKTKLRKDIYIVALNVTRYLNNTVFVSIPAIFEDGACRAYKLLGVELNGLWLQSDELTERLLPREHEDLALYTPAAFVPFAQIAGVMVATNASPSVAETGEASARTRSATRDKAKPATQAAASSTRKPGPRRAQ
jgi:hypothetical protein